MTKELYYKRAFKIIELIYDESMYGVNDLYRIKDIIHSFDDNHWKSKQWLVDETDVIFRKLYPNTKSKIFIAGAWYGLLAHLFRQKYQDSETCIISSDLDHMAEYYGKMLFRDNNIIFRTENSLRSDEISTAQLIVSTSCEHIEREDLCEWVSKKNPDAIIALQSNNFYSHQSHVNCSLSLDDFVDYIKPHLPKKWIAYAGELDLGDFKRFMIIGQ
jgi:hypothetical protein